MATSLISADKILDAILQAAHQPVFIKDQDGAYVVVNAAAARILGAAVDEIVGRTDLVLFPGELGVRLHHMSRQTVETGSPITFAIQRQLDGAVAAYIVRQYPYESQHNRLGAVGFMEAVEAGSSVTKVLRQSGGTVLSLDEASRAVGYAAAAASAAPPLAVAQSRQRILQLNRALLALQSAATAVASSLNLQHVLDTFTWEMVNLLDTESCFVLEWLPEADKIRLLATYQVEDWEAATAVPPDIPLRSRPTTRNVLVDRHITQLHVSQPYLEAGERAYLNLRGARKLLLLPMVFQDRVLGIVEVLERGEQRVFSDQEVSLAQLLANQAAAAVANARLYEELEQRLQELSSLNQIGQAITSTLDLEKTLTIITNHTLTLLRVEAAAVALLDEERGDAWYAAVSGAAAERMRGRRLPLDRGIIGQVMRSGEPLLVPAAPPPDEGEPDPTGGFKRASVLCVPLRAQGEVIGAIQAVNRVSGAFSAEDVRLLSSLAAPAAAAIVNARLYARARQEIIERRRAEAQIQTSLQEKEVLLKEIHHRVKNNLQVISSLINLQSDMVDDATALEVFHESQNRIRSMALIHEKLYQSRNLAHINLAEYVEDLTSHLFRSYSAAARGIQLDVDVADIHLGINTAVPCGLLLNELVSNALKHAFPGGRNGRIWLRAWLDDVDRMHLQVGDDGIGFSETVDFRHSPSLGLQLVNTLVGQLDGDIQLLRHPTTTFNMQFTLPKELSQ